MGSRQMTIIETVRSLTSTWVMTEMAWRDRLMSSACELAGALRGHGKRDQAWVGGRRANGEEGRPGSYFAYNASKSRRLSSTSEEVMKNSAGTAIHAENQSYRERRCQARMNLTAPCKQDQRTTTPFTLIYRQILRNTNCGSFHHRSCQ